MIHLLPRRAPLSSHGDGCRARRHPDAAHDIDADLPVPTPTQGRLATLLQDARVDDLTLFGRAQFNRVEDDLPVVIDADLPTVVRFAQQGRLAEIGYQFDSVLRCWRPAFQVDRQAPAFSGWLRSVMLTRARPLLFLSPFAVGLGLFAHLLFRLVD